MKYSKKSKWYYIHFMVLFSKQCAIIHFSNNFWNNLSKLHVFTHLLSNKLLVNPIKNLSSSSLPPFLMLSMIEFPNISQGNPTLRKWDTHAARNGTPGSWLGYLIHVSYSKLNWMKELLHKALCLLITYEVFWVNCQLSPIHSIRQETGSICF